MKQSLQGRLCGAIKGAGMLHETINLRNPKTEIDGRQA